MSEWGEIIEVKLNSEEKAKYRLILSEEYLRRIEEALTRGDHFAVISNSQLAVETQQKQLSPVLEFLAGAIIQLMNS